MRFRRSLCALLAAMPAAGWAAGFQCLIEPSQIVEVRSSVDGVIAAVHAQRGDFVRKGKPLVELQSAVERLAVDQARFRSQMDGQIIAARTRVEFARKKVDRMADLQNQNYVSAQARDEAETERRLAESELQAAIENRELAKIEHQRAKEQLALRTIESPFNGVVLERMLNPGDLAESGAGRKPVLRIAQIDPLHVDIILPATLFGQVKVGQKAVVMPQVGGGRYSGSVKMIDKMIDPASATFVARLELANPKAEIPGGARCTADLEGLKAPAPGARSPRDQ